ncbi:hypothetical protein JW756_04300 [Candidatus Woesearchaeota archaeon]|nr:hypothetical protein [Candidatus Woesearchaeota archaeon]
MSMDDIGKLLVKHGFMKKNAKVKYRQKEDKTWFPVKEDEQISPSDADMEVAEEVNIQTYDPKISPYAAYQKTGYPAPFKRYRLVVEAANLSIEETYYWLLNYMKQESSYPHIEKLTDIFTASEQSAFWGAAQSRVGIQQDRVSNYLKGISEMIKQLFQLVRELRILDEKLEPRKHWGKIAAADVALKGEYTDLVENRGQQIQPGSIYHLAQSVGFTILPDLFFNTHIYSIDDLDKTIDAMKFNKNVKQVLRRKMYAFINWKLKSDQELENRRVFTLKYLRQHWNVIKMYMNWVKPYLKNIARLQMNPEMNESPELISSFETSITEIELLAYKDSTTSYHPTLIATFRHRTRPDLSFQRDQYAHKGPIHVGVVEVTLRGYGWTKSQIEAYKKMKKEEDMMLLGMVDESVKAAMDALGEDLEKYLYEAGEKEFEEKRKAKEAAEKKKKRQGDMSLGAGMFEPFLAVFQGFGEMFSLFAPTELFGKKKEKTKGDPKGAAKAASAEMYQMYKNYKKAHAMLSW